MYSLDLMPSKSGRKGMLLEYEARILKKAKNSEAPEDVQGLPVAEDHHRQREEAVARHLALEAGARRHRERQAAHAAQHAGDEHADVAHLVHVDAHACPPPAGARRRRAAAAPAACVYSMLTAAMRNSTMAMGVVR